LQYPEGGALEGYQLNAAGLLLLVRDGANDISSVRAALAVPVPYLVPMLTELHRAGLIDCDPAEPSDWSKARFQVSAHALELQRTLGYSLRELAAVSPDRMTVQPYFGPPVASRSMPDIFVLMPFESTLEPVFSDHITNVVRKLKMTAQRGDNFFSTHYIMTDIWNAIWFSRAIIADCTTRNPNVFYEIGVAHAVGRPVILITQRDEDVPFDLRSVRYIKYEFTPRGMAQFESRLSSTLKTILDTTVQKDPLTLQPFSVGLPNGSLRL
jgi:hypothetical protein